MCVQGCLSQGFSSSSMIFSSSLLSVLGHDRDKLVVVELSVLVDVRLHPELQELLFAELLAQRRGHGAKLLHLDEAVVVPVKDLESLLQVLEICKSGSES